jgi:hypothetical protein
MPFVTIAIIPVAFAQGVFVFGLIGSHKMIFDETSITTKTMPQTIGKFR